MPGKIPPRIIQTGKTRPLPLLAQAAAANLQCLNPGFEYLFFDDAAVVNFVETEFPEYRQVFHGFPFKIQKFDFFRYLAVFRLGGFYFDLDVFLARSVAELLEKTCAFPFEELTTSQYLRRHCQVDWEIGNYAFAAAAGHPFLKAVIENCVKAQTDSSWSEPMLQGIPKFFRKDYEVLNTTGPGLLTRTLMENPELAGDVTVLFPDDVCDRSSWHQFGNFGVHAMEGSWRNGGFLQRRLRNLWESRMARRGYEESQRLGKTRTVQPR